MDGFDMGETIYKAFLAGVGAVAAGAETGQQRVIWRMQPSAAPSSSSTSS